MNVLPKPLVWLSWLFFTRAGESCLLCQQAQFIKFDSFLYNTITGFYSAVNGEPTQRACLLLTYGW